MILPESRILSLKFIKKEFFELCGTKYALNCHIMVQLHASCRKIIKIPEKATTK
jgi:hypothetical protein